MQPNKQTNLKYGFITACTATHTGLAGRPFAAPSTARKKNMWWKWGTCISTASLLLRLLTLILSLWTLLLEKLVDSVVVWFCNVCLYAQLYGKQDFPLRTIVWKTRFWESFFSRLSYQKNIKRGLNMYVDWDIERLQDIETDRLRKSLFLLEYKAPITTLQRAARLISESCWLKKLRGHSGGKNCMEIEKQLSIKRSGLWVHRDSWFEAQMGPFLEPNKNAQRLPLLSHLLRSTWAALGHDCWSFLCSLY